MSTHTFDQVAALPDDDWSAREFSSYSVKLVASSETSLEFLGVALFRFVPERVGSEPLDPYDDAPPGLSIMRGYADDQRLWGSRVGRDRPTTFVLRTPMGIFVTFAGQVILHQGGATKRFSRA